MNEDCIDNQTKRGNGAEPREIGGQIESVTDYQEGVTDMWKADEHQTGP